MDWLTDEGYSNIPLPQRSRNFVATGDKINSILLHGMEPFNISLGAAFYQEVWNIEESKNTDDILPNWPNIDKCMLQDFVIYAKFIPCG